ncbi:MAG TPA: hypothetical protein VFW96_13630 [Thermomicrobiales bacterium]|nr:hypothetical protein [Thermomicrobiales bacterium]
MVVHFDGSRHHPARAVARQNPLVLDSKPPALPPEEYSSREPRYRVLPQADAAAAELPRLARADVRARGRRLERRAAEPTPAA